MAWWYQRTAQTTDRSILGRRWFDQFSCRAVGGDLFCFPWYPKHDDNHRNHITCHGMFLWLSHWSFFVQGGGSSPWLSEFETFLGKLDRENLARATKPNPDQPQGNQDCQLKPQLPSESQNQGQLAEEERSIAWRVPLLHFVVEARTVLNVTTTDDRVRRTVLETFDKIHCKDTASYQR